MKVTDYLVGQLASKGVTDVFGIPGGVVLDLLYSFDRDKRIKPHLSYNEQAAAFEACGYAQVNHSLGVAYATRGPGFTNLITGIADAYADSIPVLFITSHSGKKIGHSQRFEKEQEMDTVSMVKHITKYARTVDENGEVCDAIQTACYEALHGRKGPVLLDVSSELWNQEININNIDQSPEEKYDLPIDKIINVLQDSKRPLILVGDGIRQANAVDQLLELCRHFEIPILSSRCGQDVASKSPYYYGYIGSHGIRYSNFIFSKADAVIAIGNRMGFPVESKSFIGALKNKKVIRFDIDDCELQRSIPNTESYKCDAIGLLTALNSAIDLKNDYSGWIQICDMIREELKTVDSNEAIEQLATLFNSLEKNVTICADVGNNEFWVSRAYVDSKTNNRILYSKSFGALGCGIPKAIGAALATKRPVLCVVGDQGFQLNVQELQFIADEALPVAIIVINNHSSGMIRSRQKSRYAGSYLHTTFNSGYGEPDIRKIAEAYGIQYIETANIKFPSISEISIDEEVDLTPNLPAGNECQNMVPILEDSLYKKLQNM